MKVNKSISSLNTRYKAALEEFVGEAVKKYKEKIKKMILYGSSARRDADADSDIDVLVVWEGETLEAMNALGDIAFEILLRYGCDISIHPMTPEHYEYVHGIDTHFIRNVEREGIVVA